MKIKYIPSKEAGHEHVKESEQKEVSILLSINKLI
jgi:hypothetical protein